MDNTTQLLVRACKRMDSTTRLLRVYKRFYYGDGQSNQENIWALVSILAPIVEMYCPIRISKVLSEIHPDSVYNKERTYQEAALSLLVGRIAFTRPDDFDGLRQPAWLRNRSR